MLCLICKYYLNTTFLPRSTINRLLNFADVYICFWFSVKTVLLILCLTKFDTKFAFFCFILLLYSFLLFTKRKNDLMKKKSAHLPGCLIYIDLSISQKMNYLKLKNCTHQWKIHFNPDYTKYSKWCKLYSFVEIESQLSFC